ncbi:MAG: A/G-specific adenine glycosylase [Tannerellaceae bacterium]|jgi:A/G-specific adenine glycosylase|nr:A/G-specific adenine glycosylase [Tannerellaceae bacterium]
MKNFSLLLRRWFVDNARDLPWRHTTDPYHIWVSEIILQQTRVAQGIECYQRFIERFRDIHTLSCASEEEVLKCWEGMGYYSRARNLHRAAQEMVRRFGGKFPQGYEDVRSLPGIGDYTAAAILSFAWEQPYAVVDGNVYRLLSRFFAIETPIDTTAGKKEFANLAASLLPEKEIGIHNQAVMEFGALHCVPRRPNCTACILRDHCAAGGSNAELFPVKQRRTAVRNRYLNYFYILYKNNTWIRRRTEGDIWCGLYEFPLIETSYAVTDFNELTRTEDFRRLFGNADLFCVSPFPIVFKHILSHQTLFASFYRIETDTVLEELSDFICIAVEHLADYPFPRLFHRYLYG